jgi:hypothetical protein
VDASRLVQPAIAIGAIAAMKTPSIGNTPRAA